MRIKMDLFGKIPNMKIWPVGGPMSVSRTRKRLLKAPQDGLQKGKSFAKTFLKVRSCYYREKGWDVETGKPLPETLRELNLDDLIDDIW